MLNPKISGRAAVLDLVKREGPIAAEALAEKLGITAMAVRQHLEGLEADGLAAHEARPAARGRPAKYWTATDKAADHFPDSHAQLATDLIGQMKKAFGDKGLDALLKLRTLDQSHTYREALAKAHTLKARLEALAAIRSTEGYMAEVRREPKTGAFLFVESHCPICAAAKLCTGLCREELLLFQKVLGRDVKVERISHILAGAGRCAYRVSA
ncbi:MAG TPA: metalloregulator ArsR/SmtB family transcription factor [Rhizomicrobium sp.]|nr:metalloregulator ArsR/SmtB family transcription factor [Rhizomicrobium sp.]